MLREYFFERAARGGAISKPRQAEGRFAGDNTACHLGSWEHVVPWPQGAPASILRTSHAASATKDGAHGPTRESDDPAGMAVLRPGELAGSQPPCADPGKVDVY